MTAISSKSNFLRSITGGSGQEAAPDPVCNPGEHSPFAIQNRVIIERFNKEGELQERKVRQANILTSYGLDRLAELMATSALVFTATNGFVWAMAVGTTSTAAASTDTGLLNSTAIVHISDASMAISDAGARTLEYQATFDDANAYTLAEVGLFNTNNATTRAIARSGLAASDQVIKGTGDTVNISYQFIYTTV